ncbi:RagB/SusD family nutrient uptake outer membrane protein [Mucilaginibacter mali]|uniref:RagB/SusD family nutrient uptake outer membrane protein n=1 Tax=Mucilaginibacter mali TaxID=2740462 RepID=A0A7D4Q1U7_9SPHI|nr:RagB/SusD family nutrient uptake outer membrane protein [Mucilaginibacter mali]QKJ30766.1 RagB/SusD family nutrient uptake outer membrane protein [Mucilaginibacter mali]
MKKFKYILMMLAVAVCSLPACKKYLDYQSPSKLNIDQTFNDVNNTNSQVIGIYTELAGSNAYGNQLSIYFHIGADEFSMQGSSSFDTGAAYAIPNYGTSSSNTSLYSVFVQLYNGIERANIACKYIPLSPLYTGGSAAQKAQMQRYYGEALALRAQFYYELIRNWGDVPATFIPAADLPTQFLKNTNRDSTYDHILADLKTAEDLVPWRDAQPDYVDFRFTKGAVKALRARIALARGGYSLRTDTHLMERRSDYQTYYKIAYDETLDIINSGKHGLNPNYENVFKTLHTGSTRNDDAHELMFEVAMWGQINDSNLASANGMVFSNSPSWGNAGGRQVAIPTYYYEFDATKDIRRDVTLAQYQVEKDVATSSINTKIPYTAIRMGNGKFRKSWTAFSGTVTGTYGVNWPIIRYADVLLMYAEAANELGTSGSITPLAALQMVQRRAYGANTLPVTPTDKAGFFTALVKERLLEFGGEGIRKYDLIRWNLLTKTIADTRAKMRMFAFGAPATDPDTGLPNPYNNYPQYTYPLTAGTPFSNGDSNSEAASLLFYGNVGPSSAYFTPNTTSGTPAGCTQRYWRREAGLWTAGVLTSTYINDGSTGWVCRFETNKKELLPYPDQVMTENRGGITQNYGY